MPSAFLSALLANNFNYTELARSLSPYQLVSLTQNEEVHAHLQALLTFTNTCLQLKHAQARAVALDQLTHVAQTTDDLIEKRRAATALLRATGSPPPPGTPTLRVGSSPCSDPAHRSPLPAPSPPPRPLAKPQKLLSPEQVFYQITRALSHNHSPEPNTGLATIAAFIDHDAEINGEVIPTDHIDETIEALEDSELSELVEAVEGDSIAPLPAKHRPRDAAKALFSLQYSAADDPADTRRKLLVHLTRSDYSRHPGCWLISKLDISEPEPHPPPAKPP